MSDGMTDSRTVGRLGKKVVFAAMDLRDAIDRARAGHRGMSPLAGSIEEANKLLRGCGFELRPVEKSR